uniref:IS200/IS605 family transposase n=1 Tax=Larkinella soli TaxID=1770527 RepID=UPI00286E1CBF|nr:IS200/IS605 family transposase [Larkinella soli]
MPNSYAQLYIHLVFAVKYRSGLIRPAWKEDLYRYITGIIRNQGHQLIAINGMPDHLHILIGLNPRQSLSDPMQGIKGDSSRWINQNRFTPGRFEWQQGYGAFSYSRSQIDTVVKYIER